MALTDTEDKEKLNGQNHLQKDCRITFSLHKIVCAIRSTRKTYFTSHGEYTSALHSIRIFRLKAESSPGDDGVANILAQTNEDEQVSTSDETGYGKGETVCFHTSPKIELECLNIKF